MRQPELHRLPLGIDSHELGVKNLVFSFFLERDIDGLVGITLTREAGLEDGAVVDINAVLDLQIVQVEIAQLVGIADAHEIERNAHLGGVA